MATIATAEVQVIADTSRFVPDLRRKLRAAFASLGNQLGDDIVQRIDRRISQRLTTVMNQAARRAGQTFSQAFNQSLGEAGLSESLRSQLGGADAQRGARRAGDDVGEAFSNAFGRSTNLTQEFLDDLGNQAAFAAAGRAGADTAQSFSDAFRSRLNERLGNQMKEEFTEAVAELEQLAQIPRTFRRIGNTSATNFVDGFTEETENRLVTRLGDLFQRIGNRFSEDAGERSGSRFARGFLNALRSLPGAFLALLNVVALRPLAALGNIFAEMSSEMLSMAGQMLAVVALLEALSGLLFGLPAATNVAAAGIAAIIVPLLGTQDAFSEAFGEAENFEDALEGLTTPAQDVARELRAIAPALNDLRLQAQAAFFSEIDGAITEVANNLVGPLTTGLASASGAFGRIVDQIGEFLAQSESADTVAAVFESLTGIFDALAESTVPFLEGIRTLVDEFLPRISELEDVLSEAGADFRDWAREITESGEAMEAFDRGIDTLEEIASIARDISGIFDSMFDAAESQGIDALGAIGDAVADIRAEFESLEGQEALGTFFDSLGRIADVLGGIIGTLIANLAELSPELAELAEEVGPPVEDFINGLVDGFKELLDSGGTDFLKDVAEELSKIDWAELGETLGTVLSFLGTLLPLIRGAINGIVELFQAVSRVGQALFGFIDTLDENIFQPISDGASNFADEWRIFWTETLPSEALEGLEGIGKFISETASGWADLFVEAGKNIETFFTVTLPVFAKLGLQLVMDEVNGWAEDIKQGFKDVLDGLGLDTEAGFGSLGEIIMGQLGLTTADIEGWETDLDLSWVTFWTSLPTKAGEQLDKLVQGVSTRLGLVRDTVTGWAVGLVLQWRTFWNGLVTAATLALINVTVSVSSRLSNIRSTVSGWISGVRALWTIFWSGLTSAVSSGLSAVQTRVSNALSGVRNAFSTMSGAVRNILSGLVGFLANIASQIAGIVGRISSAVSNAVSAASSLSGIDLNPFADGGIVYGPTPALVGEAGPEVIIPLTRPQRAVDLVQQSGLMGLLASQGVFGAAAGTTSGPSPEIHVHSALADPEQIARRAVRILERQAARGIARTGG